MTDYKGEIKKIGNVSRHGIVYGWCFSGGSYGIGYFAGELRIAGGYTVDELRSISAVQPWYCRLGVYLNGVWFDVRNKLYYLRDPHLKISRIVRSVTEQQS